MAAICTPLSVWYCYQQTNSGSLCLWGYDGSFHIQMGSSTLMVWIWWFSYLESHGPLTYMHVIDQDSFIYKKIILLQFTTDFVYAVWSAIAFILLIIIFLSWLTIGEFHFSSTTKISTMILSWCKALGSMWKWYKKHFHVNFNICKGGRICISLPSQCWHLVEISAAF